LLVGVEAALWSELLRTAGRVDAQLWPRMLAISERAWHKAAWEQALETHSDGHPLRNNKDAKLDLAHFMMLIGSKELRRLEAAEVEYYLPRPGARYVSRFSALGTGSTDSTVTFLLSLLFFCL